MITNKWYGWRPDLPDFRDFKFTRGVALKDAIPNPILDNVDLRTTGFLPPVFDQGDLGSCTANSLSELFYFVDKKQTGISFLPSRLFIYFNERKVEGTVGEDAGASLRTGIKTIVNQGVCLENLWPYHPELFSVTPPQICYTDAQRHEAKVYRSVNQTADAIKGCLSDGFPVTVGLTLYDSFESDAVAASGIVAMPGPDEQAVGGHAVLIVGYDPVNVLIMNSWGADWGQNGFFQIPWEYVLNPDLASDFWMVHAITPSAVP